MKRKRVPMKVRWRHDRTINTHYLYCNEGWGRGGHVGWIDAVIGPRGSVTYCPRVVGTGGSGWFRDLTPRRSLDVAKQALLKWAVWKP